MAPSDKFKEAILQELLRLEQSKRDAHQEPTFTMWVDFRRHVSDALNELYTEGRIRTGKSVNDTYIETT